MEPDIPKSAENGDSGKDKGAEKLETLPNDESKADINTKNAQIKENESASGSYGTDKLVTNTDNTAGMEKVSPKNTDLDDSDKFQLITSTDEEGDDDVPGDFFDDFLKEDFMAGLDIVDDDEWDEEKGKQPDNSSSENAQKRKKPLKRGRRKERKENAKSLRSVDRKNRRSREREEKHKHSKVAHINVNEFDIRRDPNKTKRDIERDKARCEKDKEKKIISEQLQLVETGLVPPGMEMETDIKVIKQQKEQLEPRDDSFEMSPKSKDSPPKEKSITPRKRRSANKISPKRISRHRSRSPRRKSRSPRHKSRSPRRKSRSPIRFVRLSPRRSPRRSIQETSFRRRSHDRIPVRSLERSRRSRTRSPIYRRRRRSRSRTRSPKRRREEKKSFLQEIAEKLNETRPVNVPFQSHLAPGEIYHIAPQVQPPVLAPLPAPVPPPPITTQYPPQQQRYDRYDQSFFIGTPQTNIPTPLSFHPGLPGQVQNQMPIQQHEVSTPQLNTSVNNFNQQNIQSRLIPQPQDEIKTNDLNKLFQDKKIALTEFLAITAKPEVYSGSPASMKEKIKVITRCQEAIKYMGNSEQKFTGPLIIHKTHRPKSSQEKFRSPLVKSSQMKFSFTEIPRTGQQKSEFSAYINRLLENLGLVDDVIVIDPEPDHIDFETSNKPSPPAPLISANNSIPMDTRQPVRHGYMQLSKFVQTEMTKCGDCDKRNKITYKSTGVQCGGDSMMFSIGIQVRDDDFYPKIPKNQSLASLTPAQLLARSGTSMPSRSVDVDDFDLLFPLKKSNRPPGYPYPQETPYTANRFNPPNPRGLNFELPGGARGVRPEGSNRYNNYF